MKRLYGEQRYLDSSDALAYISLLLGTDIGLEHFERFVLPSLDCYMDFNGNEYLCSGTHYKDEVEFEGGIRVRPAEREPHLVVKGDVEVKVSNFGAYIAWLNEEAIRLRGECIAYDGLSPKRGEVLGVLTWHLCDSLAGDLLVTHQYGQYTNIDDEAPFLVFKSSDIREYVEALHDKPSSESLQQEVKALRAEVERLQVKNAELKADIEINPKTRTSLYRIIAGLAQAGYRYDFYTANNGDKAEVMLKDINDAYAPDGGVSIRALTGHLAEIKENYRPSKSEET